VLKTVPPQLKTPCYSSSPGLDLEHVPQRLYTQIGGRPLYAGRACYARAQPIDNAGYVKMAKRIVEVLKLKHECRLLRRQIAMSVGIARSTVRD
jgi:hypothetical protein